ncbi:MAG: methylmalonyl Co-A mutase-associated GTPase MeaB [Flavobacteriales bacterium]
MARTVVDEQLFAGLRQGDRAALARAITLIESDRDADAPVAKTLIERCLPHSGDALRLGITGIPGVGKSTLIDALGLQFIAAGRRVAVLAIDPSSARTGGSILGDKTRMERLAQADAAFIRPTPTGGTLGGVARRTQETIVLCEAAGYDRILIETVGVGQSELDVDRMTDLNLLLMIAGAGDELQGIKRGIMEAADLIAFTKADGDAEARAARARTDLKNALTLLPPRDSGRHPDVLLTSAITGAGIADLHDRIDALHQEDVASGRTLRRRHEHNLFWMHRSLEESLVTALRNSARVNAALADLERAVQGGTKSPFQAAAELLDLFRKGGAPLL